MIRTKRGLDLPISGSPSESIDDGRQIRTVAILGNDYPGLKPTMAVAVGDTVKAGQVLFTDKKNEGVKYTAPSSGTVSAINRGAKRVFQSVVIDVAGDESENFQQFTSDEIRTLDRDTVVRQLVDSGEWTTIRTRPYAKVPVVDSTPHSIFVTAIDTRPHAVDPSVFINEQSEGFLAGIDVLSRLTEGSVFVCSASDANIPASNNAQAKSETFSGPHPAGLAGTHIHFLDPVSIEKTVWVVGYQQVIAIGNLFLTGKLFFERIVSLAGPGVENPRLLRTRTGASTDEICAGQLKTEGENRVISGSVLDGQTAASATAFLGRLHNQISVLSEGTERELLEFVMPGTKKFSLTRLYVATFLGKKQFDMTTARGSERSQIPLGTYEEVMPLDILPVQLLRALLVGDFEAAIELGCLELAEEDLSLCTFACPGKYEYGPYLRQMLTRVEEES